MKMRRHRRRRHARRNPFRRRHHARRRNPGFFSGLFAPVKEHGLGFLAGEAMQHFVTDPLLASFLPASVVAPSKVVVGPLLANLGKRFLPRFSRHWDSLAIFYVAMGVHETVSGFLGGASTKGLFGFGSIGPTRMRGIGSIGPTQTRGVAGIGQLGVPHGTGGNTGSGYYGASFGMPADYAADGYGNEY